MLDLSTAVLCDFAQVRDRLLFVSSGAVSRLYRRELPSPLGLMVGLVIEVPLEDAGMEHGLRAEVINRHGTVLATLQNTFRVSDEGLFPHEVQQVPLVLSITGVRARTWGTHQVRLYLDDELVRALTLYVVPAAGTQAVQPAPAATQDAPADATSAEPEGEAAEGATTEDAAPEESPQPAPEPEPVPEPELEPVPEPEPAAEPEPVAEVAEPVTEPDPVAEPEPAAEPARTPAFGGPSSPEPAAEPAAAPAPAFGKADDEGTPDARPDDAESAPTPMFRVPEPDPAPAPEPEPADDPFTSRVVIDAEPADAPVVFEPEEPRRTPLFDFDEDDLDADPDQRPSATDTGDAGEGGEPSRFAFRYRYDE